MNILIKKKEQKIEENISLFSIIHIYFKKLILGWVIFGEQALLMKKKTQQLCVLPLKVCPGYLIHRTGSGVGEKFLHLVSKNPETNPLSLTISSLSPVDPFNFFSLPSIYLITNPPTLKVEPLPHYRH